MSRLKEILKNIKAVIFDMDGVLSDTEPIYLKIEKDIAGRYGKILTNELIEKIKGSSLVNAMRILVEELDISEEPEKLALEEEKAFRDYIINNPVPSVSCAKEIVEIMKALGYRIALATSTVAANTMIILSKIGFKDHFESITTGDKVKRTKPAPDIYLKSAKDMGIEPKQCLAIEDSLNGCKAAKAANMKVLAVNVEEKVREKFEKVADIVYSSNCELFEDLKKLKNQSTF